MELSLVFLINLLIVVISCSASSVRSQNWHYPNTYINPFIHHQQQSPKHHQLKRAQIQSTSEEPNFIVPHQAPHPPPPPPPLSPQEISSSGIPHYLPSTFTHPTSGPRCGESFNCTSSGIFHSPFEKVLENERCVWTVVVPGASGYQLDVLYLGWDPKKNAGGSQVLINGFKRGSPPSETFIASKGQLTIPDASLLVITFISGDNPGNTTGFILQYSTLTNGTVLDIASQSKHQMIQPETIYLRHPPSSSNYYSNNELSSFMFEPKNNIHEPGKRMNVVYMRIGLDGAKCEDYMDVFELNVTMAATGQRKKRQEFGYGGESSMAAGAKWDFKGRICGYLDTQLITSNDMLMMIFQTDHGGTGYGFHLTYTTC